MKQLLLLMVLLGLTACGGASNKDVPFNEEPADRKAAISLLKNLKINDLEKAYKTIQALEFTELTQVEVLSELGQPIGKAQIQVHAIPQKPIETVSFKTEGVWKGLSQRADLAQSLTLGKQFLPDSAAYRTDRAQAQFLFRFLPEKNLPFGKVHVLEMAADPRSRPESDLKQVRLYVEATSQRLIGIEVKRNIHALMFEENSFMALFLQPHTKGWVPASSRFILKTSGLWGGEKNLRMVRRYALSDHVNTGVLN